MSDQLESCELKELRGFCMGSAQQLATGVFEEVVNGLYAWGKRESLGSFFSGFLTSDTVEEPRTHYLALHFVC